MEQLEQLADGLRDVLGDNLVGAYLYGSAVLGGLDPRPLELDVVVRSEVNPWRRSAQTHFHYFELNRPKHLAGDPKRLADDLEWDTRKVVLALPRVSSAIATDEVHSKDSAAAWALERSPPEHRPVLERARAAYRGESVETREGARAFATYVIAEIERARAER